MRNGYEMLYMPTHHRADSTGCVYEHIVVAEKKLGRELKDDECVHHINEVRNDNREENLIVFKTKADHTAFHHGCEAILDGDIYWCPDKNKDKYRRKDVNKDSNIKNTINICPICKKNIIHKRSNMCPSCSHLIRRKIDRPSKEELFELIKTKPFIQIGKMFGVSDNAIRKWCKYYNLPYKKEDINNFELN